LNGHRAPQTKSLKESPHVENNRRTLEIQFASIVNGSSNSAVSAGRRERNRGGRRGRATGEKSDPSRGRESARNKRTRRAVGSRRRFCAGRGEGENAKRARAMGRGSAREKGREGAHRPRPTSALPAPPNGSAKCLVRFRRKSQKLADRADRPIHFQWGRLSP
jgi:hypothetical protein